MVVEDPMEAVCNTAVFLASDQSMGITGECINGIIKIAYMLIASGLRCFACIALHSLLTKEKWIIIAKWV